MHEVSFIKEQVNNQNFSVFCKDKSSKFMYCNEKFAEDAELDSPAQIVNKTDADLIWHDQADEYRYGDSVILADGSLVNIVELQSRETGIATLLTTKTKLVDRIGNCIGIGGSYLDITGYNVEKNAGTFSSDKKRFYLGEQFGNAYLTAREVDVLRHVMLGYSSNKSATLLGLSKRTVETYIDSLKGKLQCASKGDIITTALLRGLTHLVSTF